MFDARLLANFLGQADFVARGDILHARGDVDGLTEIIEALVAGDRDGRGERVGKGQDLSVCSAALVPW